MYLSDEDTPVDDLPSKTVFVFLLLSHYTLLVVSRTVCRVRQGTVDE